MPIPGPALSIGKLARLTEVKVPTIRFYEQIGLLPEPDRTDSDRRLYGEPSVRRLSFIRHARQLGFSSSGFRIEEICRHPAAFRCAEAPGARH